MSFAELRLILRSFVEVLLQLFNWFEHTRTWPKVFQTWLVVLLRKVPTGIVSWGSVRPISVAATLYRMCAKMRTRHLLSHARTLASATVRPCLSIRGPFGAFKLRSSLSTLPTPFPHVAWCWTSLRRLMLCVVLF